MLQVNRGGLYHQICFRHRIDQIACNQTSLALVRSNKIARKPLPVNALERGVCWLFPLSEESYDILRCQEELGGGEQPGKRRRTR